MTDGWLLSLEQVRRQRSSALQSETSLPPGMAKCESWYISRVPAKEPKREFKVGDKIRANLHHGKIEDAVVRAVIQDDDGIKLRVAAFH